MEGLTKNEQVISKGISDLIKTNKETNAQIQQLRSDSPDVTDSIKQNLGEIFATIGSSRKERAVAKGISKSTNSSIGTTSGGKGVNAGLNGGEPATVSEKETLFGITKAFYSKHNFGDLVKSTEESTQNFKEFFQTQMGKKATAPKSGEGLDKEKTTFLGDFFTSSGLEKMVDKGKGAYAAIKEKGGMDAILESKAFKKLEKLYGPLRLGMIVGRVVGKPFRLIGKGIGKLRDGFMKGLRGIRDGILALPKKLAGLLGSAFSLLTKIAGLVLAVIGLGALSEFLRNVSPEGRKKFVKDMVDGTKKVISALKTFADFITETLIPLLTDFLYAFLDNGIVRFFFDGLYSDEMNKFLLERRDKIRKKDAIEPIERSVEGSKDAVKRITDQIADIEGEIATTGNTSRSRKLEALKKQKESLEDQIKTDEVYIEKVKETDMKLKIDRSSVGSDLKTFAEQKQLRRDISKMMNNQDGRKFNLNEKLNAPNPFTFTKLDQNVDNSTNMTTTQKQFLLQQSVRNLGLS